MTRTRTLVTILAIVAAVASPAIASAAPACGDVNDSGSVTSSDALAVLRHAVGQGVELICAPPAQPLRTGEITDYGSRSDGFLQAGIERAFTDNGDGTITDEATGLMWEKKDNAGGIHDKDRQFTWTTGSGDMNGTIVTDFLATLNAGGGYAAHKDWRIPNRFELETLLRAEVEAPATYGVFDTVCPTSCTTLDCSCTRASSYWTSTTYRSDTSGAWVVRFDDGVATAIVKTQAIFVRAVRGGL